MSRWMPDFDLRSSASFISSKEGGTPVSFNRSWMNMRSSFCFGVSIWSPLSGRLALDRPPRRFVSCTNQEQFICSVCVPQDLTPQDAGGAPRATKQTAGAIRVSGALTAVERHDPHAGALRERGSVRSTDNEAVGADKRRNERGVLRGQGRHDPHAVLAPFRACPHVMLARTVRREGHAE